MTPSPTEIAEELAGFSITTGETLNHNYVSLVLTSDARLAANPEDFHSYRGLLTGGRISINENQFPIRSQTALPATGEIVSISAQGGVRVSAPAPRGGSNEAKVGDASGKKVFGRTMLNEVRRIGNHAYAVGTRCAVYRRAAANQWDCIDDGVYAADNFQRGLQSIDGFAEDEIYTVGEGGELWRYDGDRWHQIQSPTNAALNTVVCAADGKVYAAGAMGTIVVGRNSRWQVVDNIPSGLEFWSVEWFNDLLYLTANTRAVFTLDRGANLRVAAFGDCPAPRTAYHLKHRNSELWMFGSKDIRVLTGNAWREVATLR